ncbi:FAD binding domain-containing protein [Roseibium algae]|uniref:Xanthine dehydrogenase family protein subunit M n=1 Tax=Roseibium algae TaxID=3123038 RepID=A0ABU8TNF1_9HYPH
MQFHRPETLDDALFVLANGGGRLLAGGTDFYPSLMDAPATGTILDLRKVEALRGIHREEDSWRIGATTTWRDITRADLPPLFDGLKLAAREVGSVQIQNAGTIAGNICNASPAADGVPPLLALNASVEIAGPNGLRVVDLSDFMLGVRKTDLKPDEIVTAVLVPDCQGASSSFLKLGARRYLVISIAMVAATILLDQDGAISDARLSVGACSAVARRLPNVEASLIGIMPEVDPIRSRLGPAELGGLTPLSDVRGSAEYRLEAVRELVCRAILDAVKGEKG